MKENRLRNRCIETTFGVPFDKITQQASKKSIVATAIKKKMGEKSREMIIKKYTWLRCLEQTEAVYLKSLNVSIKK